MDPTPTPRSDAETPGLPTQDAAPEPARSLRERVVREVRSRPMAWVVFALFVVAGPLVVKVLFPEAPTAVAIVGGAIFGGYCALNAVPQKFL